MRNSIALLFLLWSFFCFGQNDLYCLHDTAGFYRLAKINTTTGVINNIAPLPGVSFYILGNKDCISTHDSTYVFSGHDGSTGRLYTLDLTTGAVINNPVFGNVIVGLRYNCKDSTIYALEEVTSNNYYLVSVDKVTGLTTQIGAVGGVSGYVGDGFALDTKRGLYHFFGLQSPNIFMFSIDIKTGAVTYSQPFPDNVTGVVYNCSDSTIYGLWEDGVDYKLERIIPSTGAHTTIGVLNNIEPGFVAESASISRTGEYTYRGFSNSNLVLATIDVSNANVISNVGFTSQISGIEYYSCCMDSISTVDVEEKLLDKNMINYPNPFIEQVYLKWDLTVKKGIIEVHDVFGKLIFRKENIYGNNYTLKRNDLVTGIYIVTLKMDNQLLWRTKIVAE